MSEFEGGMVVYWCDVTRRDDGRAEVSVLEGHYVCRTGATHVLAGRGGGVFFTDKPVRHSRVYAVSEAFGVAAFFVLCQGCREAVVKDGPTDYTLTREKLCQDPTKPDPVPTPPSPGSTRST